MNRAGVLVLGLCLAATSWSGDSIDSRRTSNIFNSQHNLSTSGVGTVKSQVSASGTSQICVFCHTPHGATLDSASATPLWNKQFSSGTYIKYDSASVQATIDDNPGGSSKLCLSCHDGTLAIGQVNVLEGSANQSISMQGVQTGGQMPTGSDGYTRNLGTDLTNDHPISLVYDTALAEADGELFNPANDVDGQGAQVGVRHSSAVPDQPRFLLEGREVENAKLQCTTCHDPHLTGAAEDAAQSIKFLRGNRFQRVNRPIEGLFNEDNDILCLACHDKAGWADSAHARSDVADEEYESSAASLREFPTGMEVWQASCLNCHDTHSKQGSRRLLREGSTGNSQDNSAIEETCYQCHQPKGGDNALQDLVGNEVPDIQSDFTSTYRMPIRTADQEDDSKESHDIIDKDFAEPTTKLAVRHVECTDCHNPHRLKKTQRIDTYSGPDAEPTHEHDTVTDANTQHNNIASGVLTGAYGVEPQYNSAKFSPEAVTINSIAFTIKKGLPVGEVDDSLSASSQWNTDPDSYAFVTREYQVCMKCHSNNAFGVAPPDLNLAIKGGSSGINGVIQVTNQAMEFQAPVGHVGEGTATPAGWGVASNREANNHRSWHPVMKPTGRTAAIRTADSNQWLSPWNGAVGTQTMYCSDCHGNNTANGTSAPTGDAPWGPHGSTNPFILKGDWNPATNPTPTGALCFRCHRANYGSGEDDTSSGFNDNGDKGDLHDFHIKRIGTDLKCTWCHVALPHGWKNKAFLVNINDIGPECAGFTAGTSVAPNFTCAPYYQNAYAKIDSFAQSGQWVDSDCGGKDYMKDNCSNPN